MKQLDTEEQNYTNNVTTSNPDAGRLFYPENSTNTSTVAQAVSPNYSNPKPLKDKASLKSLLKSPLTFAGFMTMLIVTIFYNYTLFVYGTIDKYFTIIMVLFGAGFAIALIGIFIRSGDLKFKMESVVILFAVTWVLYAGAIIIALSIGPGFN